MCCLRGDMVGRKLKAPRLYAHVYGFARRFMLRVFEAAIAQSAEHIGVLSAVRHESSDWSVFISGI